jgi:hypothetical protein
MPSVDPDSYVEENPQVASGKKYLSLVVPAFSQNLTSYLCLGSNAEWIVDNGRDPSVHGQTLANMVRGFCDDDRSPDGTPLPGLPGGPARGNDPSSQAVAETVDDVGNVTPSTTTVPAPTSPFPNLMENESALLQVKGGWRDHSDGNRITTTYGDKVEVIRGNYKLLVLGRQDDPTQQVAGWDVSGGLVSTNPLDLNYPPPDPGTTLSALFPQSPAPPPAQAPLYGSSPQYPGGQQALCTQYTWEQDSDGRWGWTMATTTGAYAPPAPNQGNGRVVDYTWVDEIFSYWGSGKPTATGSQNPDAGVENAQHPLKKMISREWAETIVSETRAMQALPPNPRPPGWTPTPPTLTTTTTSDGDMTTIVTAGGAMTSTTSSVADMNLTVDAEGTLTAVTSSAGDMVSTLETVISGSLTSNTLSDGDLVLLSQGGPNGTVNVQTSSGQSLVAITTAQTDLTIMTAALGHQDSVDAAGNLDALPGDPSATPCHLKNSVRSAGDLTNETEANTNLYNHQTSQSQEDLVVTKFHTIMEWSALLVDLKPGIHLDVHNIHADTHLGNHLDIHVCPHLTVDCWATFSLHDGPSFKASETWTKISPFALLI